MGTRGSGRALALVALAGVVGGMACGEPPAASPAGTTTTGPASTGGGSTTAVADGESSDETAAERLDLGGGGDLPIEPMRCDKIDLVFVVDNSASMFDEQLSLQASFPEFVEQIEQVLPSGDYQVLVLDTDVGPWNDGCYAAIYGSFDCGLWCGANCEEGCNCECNAEPCAPFSPMPCDAQLGAGRVTNSAGAPCGIPAGRRFLRPEDPDPAGAFQCMATVGLLGSPNERPMQALTTALGVLGEPGGCNEGFLRDDALLIVTVVTDEDDKASLGEPADWTAALVEAKGGFESSVVVLGLLGDADVPGGLCSPFDPTDNSGASAAVRLRAWAESFPFGRWGSVCEPDYVPFFRDAVEAIDEACEEFIPAG